MALQLYKQGQQIHLLIGYEDGRLALFTSGSARPYDQVRSKEGEDWALIWHSKGHKEPSIFAHPRNWGRSRELIYICAHSHESCFGALSYPRMDRSSGSSGLSLDSTELCQCCF